MHPANVQFYSPVQGAGVVLSNQCTPGCPLLRTDVTPAPKPNTDSHGRASQGTHPPVLERQSMCSPAPNADVIAASIVGQMDDALIQQVSQQVTTLLLHTAPSPVHANVSASTPLHSAAPQPSHANVSAMTAIDVYH